MNSNSSRYAGFLKDLLGMAAYLSLFGPWFILAGLLIAEAQILWVYWRLVLAFALSFYVARASRKPIDRLGPRHRRFAAIGLTAAGVLAICALVVIPSINRESLGDLWMAWLVAGLFTWVRGLGFGAHTHDCEDMHRHLAVGAIGLALCSIFMIQYGWREFALAESLPFVVFWLVSSTMATALTRMLDLDEGDGSPASIRFWLPVVSGVVAICLVAAAFLGFAAPVLIGLLHVPAKMLLRLAQIVLMALAFGIGFIAQGLIWLARLFLDDQTAQEFQMPGVFEAVELLPQEPLQELPQWTGEVAKWAGVAAIVLAAIIVTAYLLLRVRTSKSRETPDEIRESYASLDALGGWALSRWKGILKSLKARRHRTLTRRKPRNAIEIYHATVAMAERQGCRRPAHVTPHRFQETLLDCFPGQHTALDSILAAFTREFYAEDIQKDSMEMAYVAWLRLKAEFNRR